MPCATEPVRLVVFDWDGTLVDSRGHIVRAMQAAFAAQGVAAPSEQQVCEVIGLGLGVAIAELGRRLNLARQQAVAAAYRTFYQQQASTPPALFPGVRQTLGQLRQAGVLLAVATGKSRAGLRESLHQHELQGCFDATRCADEAPSKPHPGMLLELMQELGTGPASTLMIGDTDHDLHMARNAGVRAAAVSYGVQPAARLTALAPAFMLDRIDQLPGRLGIAPASR